MLYSILSSVSLKKHLDNSISFPLYTSLIFNSKEDTNYLSFYDSDNHHDLDN